MEEYAVAAEFGAVVGEEAAAGDAEGGEPVVGVALFAALLVVVGDVAG